jgi:hypothetical protein
VVEGEEELEATDGVGLGEHVFYCGIGPARELIYGMLVFASSESGIYGELTKVQGEAVQAEGFRVEDVLSDMIVEYLADHVVRNTGRMR